MSPPPPGPTFTLDRSVRRPDDQTLIGGSPRRIMRLSAAGHSALEQLLRGEPASPSAQLLAKRLLDAGIAHPHPQPQDPRGRVTVVIPVRDRQRQLARCLAALDPAIPVVLVDDGSQAPAAIATIAARHGARLIRRDRSGGPAAARNAALATLDTELVAFLDSDCVPPRDWLHTLVGHFEDRPVAAVAPRMRPLAGGTTAVSRYLALRCPLDMGADPGSVRPGARVRYVPSAALLLRRHALQSGFDEELRHGEDVDLIWRLHDAGWQIRYDPATVVEHEEPHTLRSMLARRFRYGASAGPLAARHHDRLAPARLSATALPIIALLLRGRPKTAAGLLLAVELASLQRLRHRGVPATVAARTQAQTRAQTLLTLARASTTVGLPLAPALTRRTQGRRLLRALLLLRAAQARAGAGTQLDPLSWSALASIDDAAYGAGVWWGAIRARNHHPLVPSFVRSPRLARAGGEGHRRANSDRKFQRPEVYPLRVF